MLSQNLSQYFGLKTLRPLQEKIMRSLLAKNDTLAILPTGAGKSLCYQLPATLFPGITLVLSPLLALMRDQVESLEQRGISSARWDSTITNEQETALLFKLTTGKLRLLYLSPEKALRHDVQEQLHQVPISHICIDEAHCISQWGWDFRPEYRQISHLIENITQHQPRPVISAFTATATLETARDIVHSLSLSQPRVYALPFQRPNLQYRVIPVRNEVDKRQRLLQYLARWKQSKNGSALIYTSTRYETEELGLWLREYGFSDVLVYHAGLTSNLRSKRQELFQKRRNALMIATSAFGMGVDKPDVRYVFHHTPPPSLEAYVQEAGRAGRDGFTATPILFYSPQELVRNWKVQASSASGPQQEKIRKHALAMQKYCESRSCLASRIESSFYQPPHLPKTLRVCGCSNCVPGEMLPTTPLLLPKTEPDTSAASRFIQLKLRRKLLAQKRNIPVYFLGNDKLLQQIAAQAPKTWNELKDIAGMGRNRLYYWGKEILAITSKTPAT